MMRNIAIGFLALLGMSAQPGGCAASSSTADGDYLRLYERCDYPKAFDAGRAAYASTSGTERERAALTTGLAAAALDHETDSERWLRPLLSSEDAKIAGSAGATLGMFAQRKSKHAEAVSLLTTASQKLTGDDKARASMFAGDSLQALNKPADAKAMYQQAAANVSGSELRGQISARSAAIAKPAPQAPGDTGAFTVQLGSYADYQRAMATAARIQPKAAASSLASPRVVRSNKGNQTLYAVRIGRFATRAEGEAARRKLGNEGLVMVAAGE